MSAMPGGRSGLLPAAEADELMLGLQVTTRKMDIFVDL
jgi:hypothetical protein